MCKNFHRLLLSLLFTLLTASFACSYENLVLQGTADDIHQAIVSAIKAKEFTKAEEILNNLLSSRRKSPDGIRMLEEMYNRLAQFDDVAILDDWCASRRESHFPLVVRGNFFSRQARELRGMSFAQLIGEDAWQKIQDLRAKAQVDYEGAYAMNPADPAGSAGMVATCLDRGYPENIMEKWFKRAVDADPAWMKTYQEKLFYLAPWWHGSKKQQESFVEHCFKNAPEGSVVYTIPLLYLAIFHDIEFFRGSYLPHGRHLETDQEAMVSGAIDRFRRDYPDSPRPDFFQGLLYQMGRSNEEALASFTKARTRDARYIKAWVGEAYTELVLKRPDKAEETLKEILKLDPHSTFALMNLGYVRMLLHNDYSGGMQLFDKGVQATNDINKKMDGLYRLASFLDEIGKFSESLACYSRILEMHPAHTRALLGRAVAKNKLGDHEGAMQDVLTVQNIGGEDAESAKRLAEEFMKGADKNEVLSQPEQAAKPAAPAGAAAEPAAPSPVQTEPAAKADTPAEIQDVRTADIRHTIDDSPTAVADSNTLQQRFDACEGLYFRRLKDEATDCFSSLLLDAPEYAKTYFMLGRIAENLEADLKKAASYYNQAISKDQGNQEYILSLSQVLYMDRNFSQAIQVLTKLIEINPTHGEAFYQRGLCFDALGRKDQAIEDMQKARMYAGKSEAIEYLNKNVVISPPPPPKIDKEQELLMLVEENCRMQRFDQAEKQLLEILQLNPTNDSAVFRLGQLYIERDRDHKKALTQYDKAIKMNRKQAYYFTYRAAIFQYLDEHRKAVADYTSAIALSPKEGSLYGDRAHCLMKLGEYKQAERDLKKALTLSSGSKDMYNQMLAQISVKTGTPLAEGANSPAMLVERARAHAAEKEFDLAMKDMQQAIAIDPKFSQAYYELGVLHAEKLRLPEEAISWFGKAIELDQSKREYFFHRGLVFFEKRDFESAKKDFSSALELKKDDTQVYYYRGVCNKELGLKDQAVDDLLKARKDPGWLQAVDGLLNAMM